MNEPLDTTADSPSKPPPECSKPSPQYSPGLLSPENPVISRNPVIPHKSASSHTMAIPHNSDIPHNSLPAEEQSSCSVTHSMVGGAVAIEHSSTTVTTVAPQFQLELHSHRLNMLEVNQIQSSRMALLESRMNLQQQQNQQANFNLTLPSIAAYHDIAKQPGDDPLHCHCGLVPASKTVLAPGPDLGRIFLTCPQRAADQCPFFTWKGGSPAEV